VPVLAGYDALLRTGTKPMTTGRSPSRRRRLAIDAACRALHLPTVRTEAAALADAAARDRLTHRAYLAEVLVAEVDERDARRRERRIVEARFPRTKRLDDFDLAAAPTIPPAVLAALSSLAWVAAGEPVVLLGDPGTGKTHGTGDPVMVGRERTGPAAAG
jgi:DNA replication protein DnaC